MLYRFVFRVFGPLIVFPLMKLFNRIEVGGLDRIPAQGPAVIIANHSSMWDPAILFCLIRRQAYFMAKSELFINPVLGFILRHICVFPVKRDSIDRAALRKASEVLDSGCLLVIFPEGHRSKSGDLLPFKPGAAYFAHRAGVPVIPILLENTMKLFPVSFRPKIRITCGNPIDLSAFEGQKNNSVLLEEMTACFRRDMELLRGPAPDE